MRQNFPKIMQEFLPTSKILKMVLQVFSCLKTEKKTFFHVFHQNQGHLRKKFKKNFEFFSAEISARAYVADPAEFHHPNNFFGTPYAWPYFPVKINAVAQIGRKLFRCQKCWEKMDNLRFGPPCGTQTSFPPKKFLVKKFSGWTLCAVWVHILCLTMVPIGIIYTL